MTALAEARPGRPASIVARLTALVERVAADPELWEPLIGAPGSGAEECSTMRLVVPEDLDVHICTWRTFSGVRLRSYARTTCAFRALRGAITELRPTPDGRLVPRRFVPGVSGVIHPGEVHDLRNERAEPVVTVHAFSHPVAAMRTYDWSGAAARTPVLPTTVPGWMGT